MKTDFCQTIALSILLPLDKAFFIPAVPSFVPNNISDSASFRDGTIHPATALSGN